MNRHISLILRNKLIDSDKINFIDLYSGIVSTAERSIISEKNSNLVEKFPVSIDVYSDSEKCLTGCLTPLIPDDQYKGLLYFEDNGIKPTGKRLASGHIHYLSNLRLVCWMNKKRFLEDVCSDISKQAITAILASLDVNNWGDTGNLTLLKVIPSAIPIKNDTIFNKYSYDNKINQYLMLPFDYFAIDLNVSFYILNNCIPEININENPSLC